MNRRMAALLMWCVVFPVGCGILPTSCGQIVEQNQVALVLTTIGNRTGEAINQEVAPSTSSDDLADVSTTTTSTNGSRWDTGIEDNFEATLITATRAPIRRPGIRVLVFPLGVQEYKFSSRPSFESPDDEGITVDTHGGKVTFDVVVHMYIDTSYPDIKERLVKLMKAYQLRRYTGSPDVLKELIRGRFQQILRLPFMQYAANRKTMELMRSKSELSRYATKYMNDRFNQLGLRFTMVAVSSAMEVPPAQQERMNAIFEQEVNRQILDLTNQKIRPLDAQIATLRQEGATTGAQILADRRAEGIAIVAKAEEERRAKFIGLLGRDNYLQLETMLTVVNSLEDGKTTVDIVPADARLIIGDTARTTPVPAAVKEEGE